MAATRVQRVTANNTDVTTLSVTPASTPTAGNLLVIFHFAGNTDQTASMTAPTGWTKATGATTTSTSNGASTFYWRVSDGTESGAITMNNVLSTGIFVGAVFEEWSAGGAFAVSPVDASGFTNGSNGGTTTITVTATGATTQANTLAFAGYGLTANSGGFLNTWTGGFAIDTTVTQRMELAVKETSATETLATTETWTTNRVARASLIAFKLPTVLPVPTGLTATAVASDRVDLSWTAVTGATGYDIERNGSVIASGNATTNFSDTGLSPSTAYSYRVRTVG